ncbi:MAG: protein kinase [Planctomycetota bacterium]
MDSKETRADLDPKRRRGPPDPGETFVEELGQDQTVGPDETLSPDDGDAWDATVGPDDARDAGDATVGPDGDVTLGPDDPDHDPRATHVGTRGAAGVADEDEDDDRLAQTYMPDEGGAGEEEEDDFRLAQTFMASGGGLDESAPDMTFMQAGGDLDESAPDMTFMPAGGGGGDLDESSPDMTFMPAGGGGDLDESSPDMTFMPAGGGDLDESSPDMTFMPGGGGGDLAEAAPDMTFMPAGGGGDLDESSPDMTFMPAGGGDLDESSPDMTFMPGGGGGDLDESAPDMTFMPAGGGGDLDESSPDMTFMAGGGEEELSPEMTFMAGGGEEEEPASDRTFVDGGGGAQDGAGSDVTMVEEFEAPSDHQTQIPSSKGKTLPGASRTRSASNSGHTAPGPSRSGSGSRGSSRSGSGASRSGGGLTRGGASRSGTNSLGASLGASRSRTALRTQKFDQKAREAAFRGEESEELFAGRYRLLGEIAKGGMGAVYKALHVDLNEVRALKVMLAGAHASDDARRRFMFEAEACARLKHPHILSVNDIGEVDGNLYFTMPFVKGADLKGRKKELSREKLLDVMIKVSDAVAYAHQRGIIHRDLKPANVMMTAEGDEPLVMDFGLAKQLEDAEKEDDDLQESELARTTEGAIMGTPYYMSPEQAQGKINEVDTRTDVYALGIILYELWAKKLPFTAKSATAILQKIVKDEAERPRAVDPTIDPDLEAIILKAIEKEADKRYSTAHDLAEDLRRLRNGEVVSAQRATPRYRLEKWLKKHRREVALAAAVFVLVVGSIAGLIGQRALAAHAAIAQADREVDALVQGVAAMGSETETMISARDGALPARREQAQELRERLGKTHGALELAARPLGGYLDGYPEARRIQQVVDEQRRAVERSEAVLDALLGAGQQVEAASQGLEGLKKLRPTALAALERAVAAPIDSKAAFGDAADAARGVLEQAKASAGAAAPAAYLAAHARLEEQLGATRQGVFAALSAVPAHAPEAARSRELLAAAEGLVREVEARQARSARNELARRLLAAAQGLEALLAAQPPLKVRDDAARAQRVDAARLARELVQRGLESDPSVSGLAEARLRANAAYAGALLTLCAYRALDIELKDARSFRPEDRAALLEARKAQLEAREKLREQLTAEGALKIKITSGKILSASGGVGDLDPKVVLAAKMKVMQLKRLEKHPLMDDELEALRQKSLANAEETAADLTKRLMEQKKAKAEAKSRAVKEAEELAKRPSALLGAGGALRAALEETARAAPSPAQKAPAPQVPEGQQPGSKQPEGKQPEGKQPEREPEWRLKD